MYVCVWGGTLQDGVSDGADPAAHHLQPSQIRVSLPLVQWRQCCKQPRPWSFLVSTRTIDTGVQDVSCGGVFGARYQLGCPLLAPRSQPWLCKGWPKLCRVPAWLCKAPVQRQGLISPLGQSRSHRRSLLLQQGPAKPDITLPWGWGPLCPARTSVLILSRLIFPFLSLLQPPPRSAAL